MPWKMVKEQGCSDPADAGTAIGAKYEEFRQVEILRVKRGGGATRNEGEARNSRVEPKQESEVCVWLGPIEGKAPVAKTTVDSELDGEYFAQIVDVEFEQVGQKCGVAFGREFEGYVVLDEHWTSLRHLTLELSGRCREPHDSSAARHLGPLERIVRHAQMTLHSVGTLDKLRGGTTQQHSREACQ